MPSRITLHSASLLATSWNVRGNPQPATFFHVDASTPLIVAVDCPLIGAARVRVKVPLSDRSSLTSPGATCGIATIDTAI